MKPMPTTDAAVAATITLQMPLDPYLQRLRALGAWWSLGSSALEPLVLMRYASVTRSSMREAGL
jgi:hypothetical protein